MRNIKLTIEYDGKDFNGWQKQPKKLNIQGEIERAIKEITGENVDLIASGRTDAKVHAINQKAHFDLKKKFDQDKLINSMNKLLPKDIYIKRIEAVPDNFHARFNVKKKTYIYKINTGVYDPLTRNYIFQYNKKLNLKNISECIKPFIGEHDFKSFAKSNVECKDYIRTIYSIDIKEEKDIVTFRFEGNGFLRYMVRNIMGTLIAAGEDKINKEQIKEILDKKDRKVALKTSNPEGLYLYNVEY